jgi:hypothetical protein
MMDLLLLLHHNMTNLHKDNILYHLGDILLNHNLLDKNNFHLDYTVVLLHLRS